jgi:hypothetical protein
MPDIRQTGVTAEGTAEADTAVPRPERGSHEVELDLGRLEQSGPGGSAAAVPPVRLHWLA